MQPYNVWCATIWSPVAVSTPSAPLTKAIPVGEGHRHLTAFGGREVFFQHAAAWLVQPVVNIDRRAARFRRGEFYEALRAAVNRRKTVGGQAALRRNYVTVAIPSAGRETSMDQPGAQTVLLARFFRSAFVGHGWLLVFVRNPREVKDPGERVSDPGSTSLIVSTNVPPCSDGVSACDTKKTLD